MICPKCGNQNHNSAQYCSRCGYSFYQMKNDPDDDGPNKNDSAMKILIGMMIPIIVMVLGLSGWFLYQGIVPKPVDPPAKGGNTGTQTLVTEETTKATSPGTTEAATEPVTQATTEASTVREPETTTSRGEKLTASLKYCDNHYADYDAHNYPSDFHKMTSDDGSFSFSYPKFLFNQKEVEVEDDRIMYRFWFDDGFGEECSLIYERYDDSGNSKKIVKRIHKNKIADMYEKDLYAPSFERKRDGKTYHTAVAAGYVDSSEKRGIYTLICNDGKSTYIMEFRHPTNGKRDQHNHKDYIIDTIYRHCSFSITTMKAETYQEFKVDPDR